MIELVILMVSFIFLTVIALAVFMVVIWIVSMICSQDRKRRKDGKG